MAFTFNGTTPSVITFNGNDVLHVDVVSGGTTTRVWDKIDINSLISKYHLIPSTSGSDKLVYSNRAGGFDYYRRGSGLIMFADATDAQGFQSGTATFGLTASAIDMASSGVGNSCQDWGAHAQTTSSGKTVYTRYARDPNWVSKVYWINGVQKTPPGIASGIVYNFEIFTSQQLIDDVYTVLTNYS